MLMCEENGFFIHLDMKSFMSLARGEIVTAKNNKLKIAVRLCLHDVSFHNIDNTIDVSSVANELSILESKKSITINGIKISLVD